VGKWLCFDVMWALKAISCDDPPPHRYALNCTAPWQHAMSQRKSPLDKYLGTLGSEYGAVDRCTASQA